MKPWGKKFLLLVPQILYIGIPYALVLLVVLLYVAGSSPLEAGEMSDKISSLLVNYMIWGPGFLLLIATVHGATSYLFVRKAETNSYALTCNLITNAAMLPIQILFFFAGASVYMTFGLIFSLFVTGGELDIWQYLPIVILILLMANAVYCFPMFLHGLFGVIRAYKEKNLSKAQAILLCIFMFDPIIRLIPTIVALVLVRKNSAEAGMAGQANASVSITNESGLSM